MQPLLHQNLLAQNNLTKNNFKTAFKQFPKNAVLSGYY